jgi:hypothetical protein
MYVEFNDRGACTNNYCPVKFLDVLWIIEKNGLVNYARITNAALVSKSTEANLF